MGGLNQLNYQSFFKMVILIITNGVFEKKIDFSRYSVCGRVILCTFNLSLRLRLNPTRVQTFLQKALLIGAR